jgi:predicted transcriptional regulator of viral defense system
LRAATKTKRSRWLTPSEVARVLRIDEATVRLWCRRLKTGKLARIKRMRVTKDGRYLVPRSEIANLLMARF